MNSKHKHFGGLDNIARVVEAERNRYDFELIKLMARYRQKKVASLGRRAAIDVVVCVLDERVRNAEQPFVPPPKVYTSPNSQKDTTQADLSLPKM